MKKIILSLIIGVVIGFAISHCVITVQEFSKAFEPTVYTDSEVRSTLKGFPFGGIDLNGEGSSVFCCVSGFTDFTGYASFSSTPTLHSAIASHLSKNSSEVTQEKWNNQHTFSSPQIDTSLLTTYWQPNSVSQGSYVEINYSDSGKAFLLFDEERSISYVLIFTV